VAEPPICQLANTEVKPVRDIYLLPIYAPWNRYRLNWIFLFDSTDTSEIRSFPQPFTCGQVHKLVLTQGSGSILVEEIRNCHSLQPGLS
jgi:hypothetical protein